VALQVDGDPYPAGWFVANVIPGALSVLAPPVAGGGASPPAG
jgi:diacylglycerol kinase family enzyme